RRPATLCRRCPATTPTRAGRCLPHRHPPTSRPPQPPRAAPIRAGHATNATPHPRQQHQPPAAASELTRGVTTPLFTFANPAPTPKNRVTNVTQSSPASLFRPKVTIYVTP